MELAYETYPVHMRSVADVVSKADGDITVYRHGDVCLVQEGIVHRIQADGPGRTRRLRDAARDVVIVSESPVPVWTGGIAFDEDHQATDAWHGFPSSEFTLPWRQWTWTGGRLYKSQCASPAMPATPSTGGTLSTIDQAQWATDVQSICDAIHAGEVTKAVLTRASAGDDGNAVEAFLRLMNLEDGTAFLFRRGNTFFGCTPERLVRLNDGEVQTHALAGSTSRGEDVEADRDRSHALAASGKDILEHELVVAFVRERLVEAGIQGVRQSSRRVRALRHVQHLETPILGTAASTTHLLDIASYLHPTPAVCGTPRKRSLALIRSLERFPRGWYTGAIGWFDQHGQGELAVALRCALQADHRFLFAGAGIVAGSVPQAEWDETENKLATLRETA